MKCLVLYVQCTLILCFCLVLKVVETVGIKHVRGTEDYDDAIKKDIRKLNLMKGILHTVRTCFLFSIFEIKCLLETPITTWPSVFMNKCAPC